MYLRHLHVQNVKLLRDVKFDLVGADGKHGCLQECWRSVACGA
jgi:hypothetical protein